MTKNFLEINNVDFNVGGTTKVKNVSFSIQNEGDIICLLGPSGIGKTTILRTIAGLEKINNGTITINNKTISSKKFILNQRTEIYRLPFKKIVYSHITMLKKIF